LQPGGSTGYGLSRCAAGIAGAQGHAVDDHRVRLLVHGDVHTKGYDHGKEADAAVLESREREALAGRGIAEPYRRN
jgi:probable rRNA maturation factor